MAVLWVLRGLLWGGPYARPLLRVMGALVRILVRGWGSL